jgi:hypothetical protein
MDAVTAILINKETTMPKKCNTHLTLVFHFEDQVLPFWPD